MARRLRSPAALLLCGTALGLIQPASSFAQDAARTSAQDPAKTSATITLDTIVIDGGTGSAVGPDTSIVARDTAARL